LDECALQHVSVSLCVYEDIADLTLGRLPSNVCTRKSINASNSLNQHLAESTAVNKLDHTQHPTRKKRKHDPVGASRSACPSLKHRRNWKLAHILTGVQCVCCATVFVGSTLLSTHNLTPPAKSSAAALHSGNFRDGRTRVRSPWDPLVVTEWCGAATQ
jgi:hypothetical protein